MSWKPGPATHESYWATRHSKRGLSGFTVVKNAITLDYCIEECVRSMLRVCDEVVIGTPGSTDGTDSLLVALAAEDHRVVVVETKDFSLACGDREWFVRWLNETRRHLSYDMMLQLDADEVLDDRPAGLADIRNAAKDKRTLRVDRLNYFRDPSHLVPEGVALGRYVLRVGPSEYFLPSDEPRQMAEAPILGLAQRCDNIKIHHVGFLRPSDKFYAKAQIVLRAFFGEGDSRLQRAKEAGKPIHEAGMEWMSRLVPYDGYKPPDVIAWMRARGHRA